MAAVTYQRGERSEWIGHDLATGALVVRQTRQMWTATCDGESYRVRVTTHADGSRTVESWLQYDYTRLEPVPPQVVDHLPLDTP